MNKLKKNGFTLIEALLALLITLIVSLCMVVFLKTCLSFLQFRTSHQDQMAILQIREILAISRNFEVENGTLKLIYEQEEITLGFDKNRLVRKKGYEILMEDIDNAYFIKEDNDIFLVWEKGEKEFQSQVY